SKSNGIGISVCVGRKRCIPVLGGKWSARQETPGGPRLDIRGASAQKPIRLGWGWKKGCCGKRDSPPELGSSPAGSVGLDGSAVVGSSPQPSGLPEPAGRFHRGATRGEVVVMTVADTSRRYR